MSKKHERIPWTKRRPELLDQWNYRKNDVTPQMAKVTDEVWWILPYDDPITGKHFDFEWRAKINNRAHGADCPFLKGNALWIGFNDFQTKCPELVSQWHPHKNDGLLPSTVYYHSNIEVWWYLPYDDPRTGRNFNFEWQAKISDRARGSKCPYLTGKKVWCGYNDLQSNCPDLAAQWHPTKNQKTPDAVTCGSGDMVWWFLPYDDPITGKHFGFEWEARIADRVRGNGCPFLTENKVWTGFNDLATRFPSLICEWHPSKNEKTPYEVACFSHDKAWWYLHYYDSDTEKYFDFEWEAEISARAAGHQCPFLTGHAVYPGFNDLATQRPDLAAQWHPTLNGDVTPFSVAFHSNDNAWWLYPYDDPETGKHFDFVWESKIDNRTREPGCPFLTGKAVYPGFNDLATKRPDLAAQWHPTLNDDVTPFSVACHSNDRVWWLYRYDDPETGKHFDFVWKSVINSRTRDSGCPFLTGNAVYPGFNDLASCYPELCKEYHCKNRKKPNRIFKHENQPKRLWKCSICGHEWRTSVRLRAVNGATCPNCRRNRHNYE